MDQKMTTHSAAYWESLLKTVLTNWNLASAQEIIGLDQRDRAYKVKTGNQIYVLKNVTHAPDSERMDFTHDVLAHIAKSAELVSAPIPTLSGQYVVYIDGKRFALYRYVEVDDIVNVISQAQEFFVVGEAIARLHKGLASYPTDLATKRTWREDIPEGIPKWIVNLSEGLPDHQAARIRKLRETKRIEAAMMDLPEQLIHRDCHPGNVLFRNGEVAGFIDCDHICFGPRVFDLAYYALHRVKWVVDDEEKTTKWLGDLPRLIEGYSSRHQLSAKEKKAFAYAIMTYHLILANWYMEAKIWEPIEVEVKALVWVSEHIAEITAAVHVWE